MVVRPGSFAVLLPVKSPGTGKSRLSALPDEHRRRLAAAFAADVVRSCLATPAVGLVLIVSDDAGFAISLAAGEALTLADPGGGLNAALRHASAQARIERPELQPVALLADLPSLTPEDLTAALAHATPGQGSWFVRDADDTGTTLYSAPYDVFEPRFGPGSAAAHLAGGATPVPGALATLRRDVDDLTDLDGAIALGVGPATADALA